MPCLIRVCNLVPDIYFLSHDATTHTGPLSPHYRDFTITLWHTTLSSTPMDEWSVRRRELYLTTHNTYKRKTWMVQEWFEPTAPTSEQSQDLYLRPREHWDGLVTDIRNVNGLKALGGGGDFWIYMDTTETIQLYDWSSIEVQCSQQQQLLEKWCPDCRLQAAACNPDTTPS